MKYTFFGMRRKGEISPLIYGHFIEHFHRQIYGGVYDPGNSLSDEQELRKDVLEAMRKIKVPILRWPGGCFVSSYHWKNAVGPVRTPMFDKTWRVEDPNSFGTDEYMDLCRKIGCEPYICTNAGTGTAEEMSDWVEYCNLETEGPYAKQRIANGHEEPYEVKYWSLGNENYGYWELGAKSTEEWGLLVRESAKLMKHVDPTTELSAAALPDLDWNSNLLKHCGEYLDWISVHEYWDFLEEKNNCSNYEQSMAYTGRLTGTVDKVRGLLTAMGLEKRLKIAFDEWNLRGWHHPNAFTIRQGKTKEEYLYPRDLNDINSQYTMADAVFTACFLNMCCRNCDIVGMANFSPIVNTRGCIYTYDKGIVLRSTYHVFDLYVNYMGDQLLEGWLDDCPETMNVVSRAGEDCEVEVLDIVPTYDTKNNLYAVSVVNKDAKEARSFSIDQMGAPVTEYRVITVNGDSPEAYNDIDHTGVTLCEGSWQPLAEKELVFGPHSVNVVQFR